MTARLVEFGWKVPRGGFRWLAARPVGQTSGRPRPFLVPAPDEGDAGPLDPAFEPALFCVFASLEPTKEAVLAFADRHGDLGEDQEVLPAKAATAAATPLRGTPLAAWQKQIDDARQLFRLWELLRRRDRQALARHVRWRDGGAAGPAVVFDSHPPPGEGGATPLGSRRVRAVILSAATDPELLGKFEAGDPVAPGWYYLQEQIYGRLRGLPDAVPSRMGWDPRRGRPALRFVAEKLPTAVWLQFAEAVSEDLTYSPCRECGTWFEVAPGLARSHRRYCSEGCRSKSYRERQDRARQLFTSGQTFEQIATELDSDAATVRGWVTGIKE
jgi:hypothetical protein